MTNKKETAMTSDEYLATRSQSSVLLPREED
jgi:hypothetical protein